MRSNVCCASTEGLKGHHDLLTRAAPATARALALSFIVGACASAPQPSAGTAPVGDPAEPAAGSPSGSSVLDGVFTSGQASRGEQRFGQVCAACHSTNEFRGGRFRIKWVGQTAGDIFNLVSTTMPEGDPGSLSLEDYANLLAYFLSLNGYPAGEEPLPADVSALQNIRIEQAPTR